MSNGASSRPEDLAPGAEQCPAVLLDVRQSAALLGMSRSAFYRLHSSGKVPLPIRLGGIVRWRRAELLAWVAAGCPTRDRWDPKNLKASA
ncbi:MAG: helix-turn-helix domain-containing protein [Nitrospira sp.]|nr:helix-turn-helix domain-containing protein [Nitrospira sp.]